MPSSGPFGAIVPGFLSGLFKQIQNIVLNDAVYFAVLITDKTLVILVICLAVGRFYGCDERMFGLCAYRGVNVGGTCIKP